MISGKKIFFPITLTLFLYPNQLSLTVMLSDFTSLETEIPLTTIQFYTAKPQWKVEKVFVFGWIITNSF